MLLWMLRLLLLLLLGAMAAHGVVPSDIDSGEENERCGKRS